MYFQANRESPIYPELQALLFKTAGLVDVSREALAPLADQIRVAFVFGSAARGELRRDSDVDVLVVGDAPFTAVADALATAQARLGRDVNPTVYPPEEFRKKVQNGHHFLTTVLQEPRLFAVGGPDELARLGAGGCSGTRQARTRFDTSWASSSASAPTAPLRVAVSNGRVRRPSYLAIDRRTVLRYGSAG